MTDLAPLATAGATAVVPESVSVPAPETNPAPPAAPETPATEIKTEDPGQPEAAPETPDDKSDAKKSSAQQRINEITKEKHEANRRAESAERTARDLQRQLSEMRQEYQRLDPNDTVGQQQLSTRAAVKAERLEQLQAEGQSAAAEAAQSRAAMFTAKIDAARERIPDIDQAMANFSAVPVSDVAADLIAESEKAAEITYFLSRNPAEAHRIHRLPPHMQGAEIARIEARVAQAPARKASAAPPPVKTNLGGGSSPPGKSIETQSMDDWSKWAQDLKKRK